MMNRRRMLVSFSLLVLSILGLSMVGVMPSRSEERPGNRGSPVEAMRYRLAVDRILSIQRDLVLVESELRKLEVKNKSLNTKANGLPPISEAVIEEQFQAAPAIVEIENTLVQLDEKVQEIKRNTRPDAANPVLTQLAKQRDQLREKLQSKRQEFTVRAMNKALQAANQVRADKVSQVKEELSEARALEGLLKESFEHELRVLQDAKFSPPKSEVLPVDLHAELRRLAAAVEEVRELVKKAK